MAHVAWQRLSTFSGAGIFLRPGMPIHAMAASPTSAPLVQKRPQLLFQWQASQKGGTVMAPKV